MNSTQENIYCISGLGADHRAFQNLQIPGYQLIPIIWQPISAKETLESYTKKLSHQIPEKNPILMGLSFGGIIAVEMAKQMQTKKVIIISSIKNDNELPFYFKFLGMIGFHHLIPAYFLKNTNPISNWLFSAGSDTEKKMLQDIFLENDITFLRWCLGALASWKNKKSIPYMIHIHGSADRLFPLAFISEKQIIKNGGHLMILSKCAEISKRILDILK
jgi:pimeloyl-ACP methyl ester carboxylesterase